MTEKEEPKKIEGMKKDIAMINSERMYHDLEHITEYKKPELADKLKDDIFKLLRDSELRGHDGVNVLKNCTLELTAMLIYDSLEHSEEKERKKMQEDLK